MLTPEAQALSSAPSQRTGALAVGAVALLSAAGGLVSYKASAAFATVAKVQATHTLAPKVGAISAASLPGWMAPIAASANYFLWVAVALLFGVLLGGIVRALVPERWLAAVVGARSARSYVLAALAGTPLMLCSCCVSPLFEGVYGRTRRLGPSLGLMLAAPALNPVAHLLTFLLFPAAIAWGRLALSLLVVLAGSALVERLSPAALASQPCERPAEAPSPAAALRALPAALLQTAWRALPAVALGVLLSSMLAGALPVATLAAAGAGAWIALGIAAIAVLLALPTFGEIPLALALQAAGAPPAAVLALLVAGPAINAPSLLVLARRVSARTAALVALMVWLVSGAGALVVGML